MAVNRYVGDYRLVEEFDENGKVRTSYEYIGEQYFFVLPAEVVRGTKQRIYLLCVCSWAAWIGAFLPDAHLSRSLFAALPLAFCAFPLLLLSELCLTAMRAKEPLEHRMADKMGNRMPAYGLMLMILGFLALSGTVYQALAAQERNTGDLLFGVCVLLFCVFSVLLFRVRTRLRAEPRGK